MRVFAQVNWIAVVLGAVFSMLLFALYQLVLNAAEGLVFAVWGM